MFLFSTFNYSCAICCNFCHRFSPSFAWIIDGPNRSRGTRRALIPSGCISHFQKVFPRLVFSTKVRNIRKAAVHVSHSHRLDRRNRRHLRSSWLRNYSSPFTKSSSSHWFSLWVTTPSLVWHLQVFFYQQMTMAQDPSGEWWKLKNHLGNLPPLLQRLHRHQWAEGCFPPCSRPPNRTALPWNRNTEDKAGLPWVCG